ncbi:hypothetical protein RND81_02G205800 [Saponaria officinalis]|uniref:Uncharacterized protein n=1 Tax=Saponaria officinalis TaxID=3572 RepID=A0AAW1MZA0_SAPOF
MLVHGCKSHFVTCLLVFNTLSIHNCVVSNIVCVFAAGLCDVFDTNMDQSFRFSKYIRFWRLFPFHQYTHNVYTHVNDVLTTKMALMFLGISIANIYQFSSSPLISTAKGKAIQIINGVSLLLLFSGLSMSRSFGPLFAMAAAILLITLSALFIAFT